LQQRATVVSIRRHIDDVQEERPDHDWCGFGAEAFAANDNLRAQVERMEPGDVEQVKRGFWAKLAAARPRFGRLSGLRDFAVNLVRLFEMLTEPGFAIPWKTTAAIVFGLAYFISSIDLIPDAIPVLGFMDDAFVLAEVMVMVAADLARFEETRRQRRPKAESVEDLAQAA
jgi:uncharacterized membrane protein YkvA (DUF1232 family)